MPLCPDQIMIQVHARYLIFIALSDRIRYFESCVFGIFACVNRTSLLNWNWSVPTPESLTGLAQNKNKNNIYIQTIYGNMHKLTNEFISLVLNFTQSIQIIKYVLCMKIKLYICYRLLTTFLNK